MLLADYSGCSYWRCLSPVTALRQQQYPAWWAHRDNDALPDLAWQADAVVLCRLSWDAADYARGQRWVDSLHRAGKAVWMECDDDLWSESCLPQVGVINPEGKTRDELDQERQARIFALQLCDGVTVSTQRVATAAAQYTAKPVAVIPNAIDWPAWQRVCRSGRRPTAALTIGWAGGKRLDADFTAMAVAWRRLAQRFPLVEFIVVGHHADVLRDAVPPERLHLIPWQPVERYPLAYQGMDIGCAPLAANTFNAAKSAIKAYEYAAAGAAVVASPTIYGAALRDGRDGYLVETAAEWEAALARLVQDAALRRQMAARWGKRVRERHSLQTQLGRWPSAWARLLADFRAQRPRLVAV